MPRSQEPVFVVGTERSGTNLVRRLISLNDGVANIPPFQFLGNLYPNVPFYGDLTVEAHFRRLVEDMCEWVSLQGSFWEAAFDPGDIVANIESRRFFAVFDYMHQQEAQARGAERWVTKDIAGVDAVRPVSRFFDDARFVWVVRDPRDVALSMIRSRVHPNNVLLPAQRWKEEQQQMLVLSQEQGLADRIHVVRYRDLLQQPEQELQAICDAVDIPFQESMLYPETHAEQEERRVSAWRNLSEPIMRGNSGKWRAGLSARDVESVEAVCGRWMELLGFECVVSEPSLPVWRKEWYRIHEWIWWTVYDIRDRVQTTDPREKERRRRLRSLLDRR